MPYLAIGLLLAGVVLGRLWGKLGLRLAGRGSWRPGVTLLSIAVMMAALVCGVREAWAPAAILVAVSLYLALSARGARPAPQARPRPAEARAAPDRQAMSRRQAASLLGVTPEAGPAAVQDAYVRLMRIAHPDRGGTSGLAAQLNAARDVLLDRPGAGWV